MVDLVYEEWKAREEAYRAERRKRRHKRLSKSAVGHFWDSVDPPVRWDNLIPRWQVCVIAFAKRVEAGQGAQSAWDDVPPSSGSKWGGPTLGPEWERALTELADGLR